VAARGVVGLGARSRSQEDVEIEGQRRDADGAPRGARFGRRQVLGGERTIEQDPGFAIRILVDIAARALSPAVNDPTTGVQIIDHLEDLLGLLGRSAPAEPPPRAREPTTRGVVIPTRSWDDYLVLGVTEIREYGATSIQIVRRLRAMLDELLGSVHEQNRAAVEDQLARLDATVAQHWRDSPDLDLAGTADRQGIGGPGSLRHPRPNG